MKIFSLLLGVCFVLFAGVSCKPENNDPDYGTLQLVGLNVGELTLIPTQTTQGVPMDQPFVIVFNSAIDTQTIPDAIKLVNDLMLPIELSFISANNQKEIIVTPSQSLDPLKTYTVQMLNTLLGVNKEKFEGANYPFQTANGTLQSDSSAQY